MSKKHIKFHLPALEIDMGGFPVLQALPTQKVEQIDPFLLLHHAKTKVNEHIKAKHQGIDPHPHRGFCPVTFVIDGEVHHRDSRGNSQIAQAGDVQWMNAGKGIIHSERPSQDLVDRGGKQEIVQVWINSPASRKMLEPYYQYIARKEMRHFQSDDEKLTSQLIAGKYQNHYSKIRTESELLILWAHGQAGAREKFEIPQGFSSMVYVVKGDVRIDGQPIAEENLIVMSDSGNEINVSLSTHAEFIVLAGRAIGEKVAQYGPYVMNNQTELLEAMRDYQMGKMGILIEE